MRSRLNESDAKGHAFGVESFVEIIENAFKQKKSTPSVAKCELDMELLYRLLR